MTSRKVADIKTLKTLSDNKN